MIGAEDNLQVVPFVFRHIDGQDRRHADPLRDRQDVHDGLALGGASALRQAPCLQLVDHPVGRKDQQRRMGVGHEQGRDHVLFLGGHARQALAAAFLRAEFGQRRALGPAGAGDGDHHILALDQVFVIHVAGPFDDLGAARDGELLFHIAQLIRNDRHHAIARAQDIQVILDLGRKLLQLIGDFLHTQLCQPLQAQFQNGARLSFRQVIGAVVIDLVGRVIDQLDIGGDLTGGPAPCHKFFARLGRIGRGTNGCDHLIHIGHSHGQTAQHMAALTRFAQFIGGATRDNFFAEADEIGQKIAQRQLLGPSAIQRQHVAAE